MANGVKFIRRNGKVIPIRDKNSAGISARNPRGPLSGKEESVAAIAYNKEFNKKSNQRSTTFKERALMGVVGAVQGGLIGGFMLGKKGALAFSAMGGLGLAAMTNKTLSSKGEKNAHKRMNIAVNKLRRKNATGV